MFTYCLLMRPICQEWEWVDRHLAQSFIGSWTDSVCINLETIITCKSTIELGLCLPTECGLCLYLRSWKECSHCYSCMWWWSPCSSTHGWEMFTYWLLMRPNVRCWNEWTDSPQHSHSLIQDCSWTVGQGGWSGQVGSIFKLLEEKKKLIFS